MSFFFGAEYAVILPRALRAVCACRGGEAGQLLRALGAPLAVLLLDTVLRHIEAFSCQPLQLLAVDCAVTIHEPNQLPRRVREFLEELLEEFAEQ